MKICPKCNINHSKNGTFCSRSCANSRGPRTEDFKNKVRNKVTKYKVLKTFICCNCGIIFEKIDTPHKKRKFCSRKCVTESLHINRQPLSVEHKNKISDIRKNLFAAGELNVTGGNTKWLSYKDIKVQGSYELRTCKILDIWKDNNCILNWEYTNDRIQYLDENENIRTYLLDFKVTRLDNSFYYIETKGFTRETDYYKWDSAKNQIELEIWFLEDILKKEAEVAQW